MKTIDKIMKGFLTECEVNTNNMSAIYLAVRYTLEWIKQKDQFVDFLFSEDVFCLPELYLMITFMITHNNDYNKLKTLISTSDEDSFIFCLDLICNDYDYKAVEYLLSLKSSEEILVAHELIATGMELEDVRNLLKMLI